MNARRVVGGCFGVVLARLRLGESTFHLRLNDEWLNLDVTNRDCKVSIRVRLLRRV